MAAMRMDRIVLVTVVFVAAFWGGAVAQSSSCSSAIVSLSPCLNYITGNSSTPSSSCCTGLSSVVASNPLCLCQILNNGGSSLGITINQTRALELPKACNVQTPSISQCNAPTGSPSASPSGSKTSPSTTTTPTTSDSNNTKMTISVLFFFIFVALRGSSLIAI
ncbi:hypothetical protein SLEP1_g1071 [Rubroshorea leprosula]|uniref:Bifunctional inhibitor/plant lipid transfer protein/seed storage helical domain-containing protein n=1 Tax=Rubroshorea leprosula TaxID=152421 RepID=A0AAV5HN25_9ROSI|nr:hypothetical protein SLEP1_g1071 [Rubroshorea leprosula]